MSRTLKEEMIIEFLILVLVRGSITELNISNSQGNEVVIDTMYNELSEYRYMVITRYSKNSSNEYFIDARISNVSTVSVRIPATPKYPKSYVMDERVISYNSDVMYSFSYSNPNNLSISTITLDKNTPISVNGDEMYVCNDSKVIVLDKDLHVIKRTNVSCGEHLSIGNKNYCVKKGTEVRVYQRQNDQEIIKYSVLKGVESGQYEPVSMNIFDVVYIPLSSNNSISVRSPEKYSNEEYLNVKFYSIGDEKYNTEHTNYIQTYGSIIIVGEYGKDKGIGTIELWYDNFANPRLGRVRFEKIIRLQGIQEKSYRGLSSSIDGSEIIIGGVYQSIQQNEHIRNIEKELKKYCNVNDCTCPRGYYLNGSKTKCHIVIDFGKIVMITMISVIIFLLSMIILVFVYRYWGLHSPAIPPAITPSYLSFGYEERVIGIEEEAEDEIIVSNASREEMKCKIRVPNTHKFSIEVEPDEFILGGERRRHVKVKIQMHCHCQISEVILVETNDSAVCIPIILKTAENYIIDSEDIHDVTYLCDGCVGKYQRYHEEEKSGVIIAIYPEHGNEEVIRDIKSSLIDTIHTMSPVNIAIAPYAMILVYPLFITTLGEVDREEHEEKFFIKVCIDVCNGLEELHKNNIIHGRLCMYNIVITTFNCDSVCGKVIGWSLDSIHKRICHDEDSSEHIQRGETKRIEDDIYSFGHIIHTLFHDKNSAMEELSNKMMTQEITTLNECLRIMNDIMITNMNNDTSDKFYD